MELFIAMHGPDKLFVGNKPVTPEDYAKKFMLALGASAIPFTKHNRGQRLVPSKSEPALLSPLAPVAQILRLGYALRRQLKWTCDEGI